jgi:hypothetical protein
MDITAVSLAKDICCGSDYFQKINIPYKFNAFHVRALYYTKTTSATQCNDNGKFLPEDDPAGSEHVGVCYN